MINQVFLSPLSTPNIHQILAQMLGNSALWKNLYFTSKIEATESCSFMIALSDDLYEQHLLNDLLLSSTEQSKLNNLKLTTTNNVTIKLELDYSTGLIDAWDSGVFFSNLNYALFQNFLYLESKLPLIFNYISRSTYNATKDVTPFLVSICLKSDETQIMEQRSVLSGLMKSIGNCKSWIAHVYAWDSRKLKSQLAKTDGFSITWFAHPTTKDQASL